MTEGRTAQPVGCECIVTVSDRKHEIDAVFVLAAREYMAGVGCRFIGGAGAGADVSLRRPAGFAVTLVTVDPFPVLRALGVAGVFPLNQKIDVIVIPGGADDNIGGDGIDELAQGVIVLHQALDGGQIGAVPVCAVAIGGNGGVADAR